MSHLMLRKNGLEPRNNDVWGLQSDINRLFDAFLSPFDNSEFKNTMTPKLDIEELQDKYEIKAELPGIDEKDINLSLDDGVLTISGEKKSETKDQHKGYYLKECSYGSFSRSVCLPENVADEKIAAQFNQGVLTIEVPKKEPTVAKARKIAISAK